MSDHQPTKVQVNFWAPLELKQRLERYRTRMGLTLTASIIVLLTDGLERAEARHQQKGTTP